MFYSDYSKFIFIQLIDVKTSILSSLIALELCPYLTYQTSKPAKGGEMAGYVVVIKKEREKEREEMKDGIVFDVINLMWFCSIACVLLFFLIEELSL